MLSKYCAMLIIIITLCIFAAVNSQSLQSSFNPPHTSSSQSVSYSGTGSSSVASSGTSMSYSGAGPSYVSNSGLALSSSRSPPSLSTDGNVKLYPPLVLDPKVEIFAHTLTKLLHSSPVLNVVPNFVITDPYEMLYKTSKFILERDGVMDTSLAEFTGEAGRELGEISRDLYYNAIVRMVAKILAYTNRLTPGTILTYPKLALSFIEDYGIKNGVFDNESVAKALTNGLFDFVTFVGINSIPNLMLAIQIFVQELKALSAGVEI